MNEVAETQKDNGSNAKIVYILYLISIVIGVTGIVGLVMAYVYKADAPDWLKTHYQWQIRTFWIGFLYAFIGAITTFILIGYLILLFTVLWFIVRCIKGLSAVEKRQPLPEPTNWLF
ncbi:DUF4870 family protein [Amphritea pacifica]|uniref:DUF4870 domain-containing protein n=1 Tax=Amphritea pacifica TaxID=2811233 RepID=A0ABS2W3F2_9GAMM|nr:hypothetical protein [Amphritea pacifica]MBN0986239.1 hypothetical protein [Amphritea pacifica]MBN1008629.1 hypothetical protein [Amphritea pacifica]